MAFVRAGVNGEAMGSGIDADEAHFDDAGDSEGAGVAKKGNFVEVDAEVGHALKEKREEKKKGREAV